MKNKELFKGHHITLGYHCEGEGINFSNSMTLEQLNEIDKILNNDLVENLTPENGIRIFLQTPKEHREACISGSMFGDGCCRKVAENIFDGIEMTDEEYDRLQDESDNEQN